MAEALIFPRLIYRGEPDVLGTGQVGETKQVADQAALDEAQRDGWRLTREDATHKARVAPGKIQVPAQTIQASASAGDLVEQNRVAAAGGPAAEPVAHPATAHERDQAVQQAEADAAAKNPELDTQRSGRRKRAAGDASVPAPQRNATKK